MSIEIDKYSDAAVNLLLGTCAQESAMGTYISQVGSGIAKGIFQMEDATHEDIIDNYLRYKDDHLKQFYDMRVEPKVMIHNLWYAAQMCRLHYLRVPHALPDKDDIVGQAEYYKKYYNTELGAGTIDEYMENYQRYAAKVAL